MKKKMLISLFMVLVLVISAIHEFAFAVTPTAISPGNAMMFVNTYITCDYTLQTVYEKNGLIMHKVYRYEDAKALDEIDTEGLINILLQNGWEDVTESDPYESEGFNRLYKKFTFVRDNFEISIESKLPSHTTAYLEWIEISLTNNDVVNMRGEVKTEQIKPVYTIGVDYSIDDEVITLSGSGEMRDFEINDKTPWSHKKIYKLIVGENVKRLGKNAFDTLNELTTIEIKNPNIEIRSSFSSCTNLKEIFFAGTQEQFDTFNLSIPNGTVVYLGDGSKWLNASEKENEEANLETIARQIKMTIGSKAAVAFGKSFVMDVAPQIINGRTMLPARYVTENLGGEIEWIAEHQMIAVSKGNRILLFQINTNKACLLSIEDYSDDVTSYLDFSDDFPSLDFSQVEELESYYYDYNPIDADYSIEGYQLDSAPVIISERTFMPVRFLATFLGADVTWDGATQTVTLKR